MSFGVLFAKAVLRHLVCFFISVQSFRIWILGFRSGVHSSFSPSTHSWFDKIEIDIYLAEDAWCRYISKNTPCIIVSVAYSLSPAYKMPTQLQEGVLAYHWVSFYSLSLLLSHTMLIIYPNRFTTTPNNLEATLKKSSQLAPQQEGLSP